MNKKILVSLKNIQKIYDNHETIANLSLDIEEGSFVTILGPSGCGKSTLLKMIGGFESPTRGKILLNGLDIKDMPIHQRPTATVFQDYALFPTMNVFQNIAYGLKKMRIPLGDLAPDVHERINQAYETAKTKAQTKLDEVADKKQQLVQKIAALEREYQGLNPKSLSIRFKKIVLQSARDELNDLDYWTSYWQTYPNTVHKKQTDQLATRKITKEEISQKVFDVIKLVGLSGNEFKMPNELSGGMQQRVALARAIVTLPKLLLLDEPLSALDAKVRKQMQNELKRLHKVLGITFILVTHDQEEALVLSDKVVVMSAGKIEQVGTADEVYDSPANPWVSNFIGKANIFDGIYQSPGKVMVQDKIFDTDVVAGFDKGQKVHVMMRPEDFDVVQAGQGIIDVYVESIIYMGKLWELKCKFMDRTIYVENIDAVEPKSMIGLVWDQIDVHVMAHEGGL